MDKITPVSLKTLSYQNAQAIFELSKDAKRFGFLNTRLLRLLKKNNAVLMKAAEMLDRRVA